MKNRALKQMKKLSLLSAVLFLTACQSIPTTQQSSEKNQPVKQTQVQTRQQQVLEVDDVNQLSPAVSALITQAQAQKNTGNSVAAMSSLERAIRIAPRHPESYYRLGELHFEQGNLTQARSLAQKAISLGATGKIRKQSLQLIGKAAK